MKAKNEAAEKFQAKVADEIIPSIRKHGAYMTPETLQAAILNPDYLLKVVTALKDETDKRKALFDHCKGGTKHPIPTNAMKQHCRGVVKRHIADSIGRGQDTNFIPESDLYRLVFRGARLLLIFERKY